jgi:hypothetical protein
LKAIGYKCNGIHTQKMSGLEILEKFKAGVFPHPIMATTLPLKIMNFGKKGEKNERRL